MAVDTRSNSDTDNLISRAKARDVEAFSELMEAEQPRLLAQAIAFCSDPEQAHDLVQETMIAAWKSLGRFDGTCQFFTWLYVILLRQHRRAIGWFSRRIPLPTPDQIKSAERREQATEQRQGCGDSEDSELLRSMVSSLPTKHREVIRLRFYAGASEEETANALGISPGTVKSRMHHGLKKLQRMKEKMNLLRG